MRSAPQRGDELAGSHGGAKGGHDGGPGRLRAMGWCAVTPEEEGSRVSGGDLDLAIYFSKAHPVFHPLGGPLSVLGNAGRLSGALKGAGG